MDEGEIIERELGDICARCPCGVDLTAELGKIEGEPVVLKHGIPSLFSFFRLVSQDDNSAWLLRFTTDQNLDHSPTWLRLILENDFEAER